MTSEVLGRPGEKVVLLGNEAIARGAVEAGIGVAAAYPGTPSSEVPMVLASVADEVGFYFEYSTNEKVAFETAAGAAWCGVRAITAMKHFGLNVASDSVLPVVYTGVRSGLVVMVADDPSGWSSAQSEQDTRYYARLARMPMIEPSNPQECLDYTKLAFDISEEFEIPVFLRTTTKVSHSIGTVELGEIREPKTRGEFRKDPGRFYSIRPRLQELHGRVDDKLGRIEEKYGQRLNQVYPGEGNIGIIALGVGFEYCREGLLQLGLTTPIAKIGMTHPMSEEFITGFIEDKEAVLILEELEPIIEDFVKQVAKDVNPKLVVHGKDMLPRSGEYNLETILPVLGEVFGKKPEVDFKAHERQVREAERGLPPRKPVLCPGCPHRSTFYAVKEVFGDRAVYAGDIGCYILGIFEPIEMQDFVISMGASAGLAHGITRVSDQDVVVFMGDSTFFHSGLPPLVNYSFNAKRSPLVVVMDNAITAMTGHQPHPGSGFTGMGEKVKPVKIEDVIKGFGAKVRVVGAFNQRKLIEALEELREIEGPRVLVARGECRLLTRRRLKSKGIPIVKYVIDADQWKVHEDLEEIAEQFACPAFMQGEESGYYIDLDLCWGCGVCKQIFPVGVVEALRREAL